MRSIPITAALAVCLALALQSWSIGVRASSDPPSPVAQLKGDAHRFHDGMQHDARQLRRGVSRDAHQARHDLRQAGYEWRADMHRFGRGVRDWWQQLRARVTGRRS